MREVPAQRRAHGVCPPRRSTALVGLAGVLVVLAACGGGDSDSDATVVVSSTTATSTTSTTVAPTTVAPTTVPTTSAPTTAPPSTVAPEIAAWCGPAARVRAASDRLGETGTDSDEVRSAVAELVLAVTEAAEVAPEALADDVATSEELVLVLERALEATDYDLLTADLTDFAERADELDAANDVIRAFNVEFCGVEPEPETTESGDEDDDGFGLGEGSFRDQFIGQLVDDGFTLPEAACLFSEIDFTDPDTYTGDEAVTTLFVTCDIDLDRIGELIVPDD